MVFSNGIVGNKPTMGLIRKTIVLGVAKKLYDESQKPENQRRIKEAVASMKSRRSGSKTTGTT